MLKALLVLFIAFCVRFLFKFRTQEYRVLLASKPFIGRFFIRFLNNLVETPVLVGPPMASLFNESGEVALSEDHNEIQQTFKPPIIEKNFSNPKEFYSGVEINNGSERCYYETVCHAFYFDGDNIRGGWKFTKYLVKVVNRARLSSILPPRWSVVSEEKRVKQWSLVSSDNYGFWINGGKVPSSIATCYPLGDILSTLNNRGKSISSSVISKCLHPIEEKLLELQKNTRV